jgi:hypothetical protein
VRLRVHPSKVGPSELIAALGGLLIGVCVFLPWYVPNKANHNAVVAGSREAVSAWDAHSILRYLFLAAALAPLILLYIVLRDHKLSWPRGEMTAVIAIAAFGIVGYLGIIDRPGEPKGEIGLGIGWFGAMLGVIFMAIGGAWRAGGSERPRKPPGVL